MTPRHITASLKYDEAGLFAEHPTDAERIARLADDFAQVWAAKAAEARAAVETPDHLGDLGIVNVRVYGAVGDGVTDDTAAIQAAIDAAGDAGGGTVYLPGGRYLVTQADAFGGGEWALSIISDNITFQGGPGAEIITAQDTSLFWIDGASKPNGTGDWLNHWLLDDSNLTLYEMSTAARGDDRITLSTASDASNFAAGDDIFIRTGQVNTHSTTDPDAELNQVLASNADTGALTLRYPLTRPFAAENYPTGHANAGNPAPFGVSKCTDRIVRNTAIRNLKLTSAATTEAMFAGCHQDGLVIENCTMTCNTILMNMNVFRNFRFNNNVCIMDSETSGDWWLATGVAATDGEIRGNTFWSTSPSANLHLHCCGRVTLAGNRFGRVAATSYVMPCVHVRSRAYGLTIIDNQIDAPGTHGWGIYVGEECTGGGIIANNRINAVESVGIGASGWMYGQNECTGSVSFYNDADDGHIAGGGVGPTVVQTISNWLSEDEQSVTVGTIPAYSWVLGLDVYVQQAFNSDGTDLVNVGRSGSASAYTANVDVSTTGRKTIALASEAGLIDTERTVLATYTNGGSEPTEGRALVSVTYAPIAKTVA